MLRVLGPILWITSIGDIGSVGIPVSYGYVSIGVVSGLRGMIAIVGIILVIDSCIGSDACSSVVSVITMLYILLYCYECLY